MTTCEPEGVTHQDWISRIFPYRCYFYPGRDCPGWKPGDRCSRTGDGIPADTGEEPERGNW